MAIALAPKKMMKAAKKLNFSRNMTARVLVKTEAKEEEVVVVVEELK